MSDTNGQLNQAAVEKIADLARLKISDDEKQRYTNELGDILAFVEQLNAADTTDIEPIAHPLNLTQRRREDTVTKVDKRELYQTNAPLVEAGLFLVPQVIED